MVRVKMCVSVWQRVGNGVFMQHVCMWWDISLSANTAPQNPLSLRCHREHTDTHNCSSLQHITVFKVCVPVWVCACVKVWPLFATVALKRSRLSQSTAANTREELKSRNRGAHTHAARQGGFNATEPESRQRKGGERLRLRHGAETGFKEWKKSNESEADQTRRAKSLLISFYSRASETRCRSLDVFLRRYIILHLGVRNITVTVATGVFRA